MTSYPAVALHRTGPPTALRHPRPPSTTACRTRGARRPSAARCTPSRSDPKSASCRRPRRRRRSRPPPPQSRRSTANEIRVAPRPTPRPSQPETVSVASPGDAIVGAPAARRTISATSDSFRFRRTPRLRPIVVRRPSTPVARVPLLPPSAMICCPRPTSRSKTTATASLLRTGNRRTWRISACRPRPDRSKSKMERRRRKLTGGWRSLVRRQRASTVDLTWLESASKTGRQRRRRQQLRSRRRGGHVAAPPSITVALRRRGS